MDDLEQLDFAAGMLEREADVKAKSAKAMRAVAAENARLRAELAEARKPLAWTREKPTEPGWYWVADEKGRYVDPQYLSVADDETGELWFADSGHSLDGLQFFGPIPDPPEPPSG